MSDIIYDLERQIEINERSGFTGGLLDNALAHIKSQNTEIERLRAQVAELEKSQLAAWDVARGYENTTKVAVAQLAEAQARAEKAEALLEERDKFIVDNGLWVKFVDYFNGKPLAQKEPKSGPIYIMGQYVGEGVVLEGKPMSPDAFTNAGKRGQ